MDRNQYYNDIHTKMSKNMGYYNKSTNQDSKHLYNKEPHHMADMNQLYT